jgi:endogenous inhibitor of DNA gyrase (YacG/DUF329 family)
MAEKSEKKAKVVPLKNPKCPNCGAPAAVEFKPFCSKRCADLDLGRWLNEDYRIPTNEAPSDVPGDMPGEDGSGEDD